LKENGSAYEAVVEFSSYDEALRAIERLDNSSLRARNGDTAAITVVYDGPAGNSAPSGSDQQDAAPRSSRSRSRSPVREDRENTDHAGQGDDHEQQQHQGDQQ
jgi:hypothetical protein